MRELKIRVWDNLSKEFKALDNYFCKAKDGILSVCTNNDDITLELPTGLKDKNGKGIYEGDIVRAEDDGYCRVGVVEWNEDYAKCEVVYNQLTGNSFEFEGDSGYPVANSCEVIGNIHENPELCGEEEE